MNREIKFRAWIPQEKKVLSWEALHDGYNNNPTYTHVDEVLILLREKLGEEKFKLFMAKLEYGMQQPFVDAIDWDGQIDIEYILNVPLLVTKAIEFMESKK